MSRTPRATRQRPSDHPVPAHRVAVHAADHPDAVTAPTHSEDVPPHVARDPDVDASNVTGGWCPFGGRHSSAQPLLAGEG